MASPRRKAYSYEVRLCELLKLKRVRDQADGSCDGLNDWLAVEMFQKPIPAYLKDELEQAIKSAGRRLPIAVWREKGKKDKDALVIIRLKDFLEWYV